MPEGIEAVRTFFARLHGPEATGHLIVWTRPDKTTRAFNFGEEGAGESASAYCVSRAATAEVYAAVGLQGESPPAGSRGSETGVVSIPGVWADIDIAGSAHKSEKLPASEEEAFTLIDAIGLPPSLCVRSGFGLQVYWLFKEPWRLESDADRTAAKSLSVRFQSRLRQIAETSGWVLDPTADLCRVLRVPGTWNRKVAGDVRLVTAEYSEWAYNLSDIEAILEGIEDSGRAQPMLPGTVDLAPARLPPILEGCPWMRHCRDDAAALPEPEWYRMITVVARCEGASRHVHTLSRPHPKYTARETNAKLRQASSQRVAPVTCAYVQADLGGEKYCSRCLFRGNVNSPVAIGRLDLDGEDPVDADTEQTPTPEAAASTPSPDASPPASEINDAATKIEKFTDLGNAKRLVAKYRDQVRYCEAWGRWFIWDRRRWSEDRKLRVCDMAADLVRGMYALAKKIRNQEEREAFLTHIIKSESHRAITAMINLAKPDKALALLPEDLDSDPWTLTVVNGTIDLRTGELGPHRQSDLISKIAPVTFDPDAQCPNWNEFLYLVMNERSSLVAFLQRAFGCCLTGVTSDKAMFILYGAGGDNGKSTMVDVIQCLLGDYAMRTPTDTFMRKKEGAIPNDVARLKGARFVWASENERGSRLSESLIKEMTGGDKLAARFMRGEFFEFYPEFKPWLATNHKPQIRGDKAIWNRLKLVPFDISIPKEKQKPRHQVMEMFRSEMPGILNWAIKGCLDWQRDGLGVPEEVLEATEEYEAEQDTFAMFLNEKCVCTANARVASNALYRAYKQWAEEYGEAPMSHKTFASFLAERGFGKVRVSKGIVYERIGLRTEDVYDQPGGRPSNRERSAGMREEDGEVI